MGSTNIGITMSADKNPLLNIRVQVSSTTEVPKLLGVPPRGHGGTFRTVWRAPYGGRQGVPPSLTVAPAPHLTHPQPRWGSAPGQGPCCQPPPWPSCSSVPSTTRSLGSWPQLSSQPGARAAQHPAAGPHHSPAGALLPPPALAPGRSSFLSLFLPPALAPYPPPAVAPLLLLSFPPPTELGPHSWPWLWGGTDRGRGAAILKSWGTTALHFQLLIILRHFWKLN